MAKAFIALTLWLCLATSAFAAAPAKKGPPSWAELSQEQRQILAPLEAEWNALDASRKRKWIGIAKRYPGMTPEEKAKTQRRMQPWANLSSEERRAARERFKKLEQLPPEKRQALRQKWDEYNSLPKEERDKLRKSSKSPSAKAPSKSRPAKEQPPAPTIDTTAAPPSAEAPSMDSIASPPAPPASAPAAAAQ